MANIVNLITIGEKQYKVVDADPSSGLGTSGAIGDLAVWDDGSVGRAYVKVGPLDTDWDKINTVGTSGSVSNGVAGRLGLYPSTGNNIDDVYVQNSQDIVVEIESQPSRTSNISYRIPNPGNAIGNADFILSQGAQTISGIKTFSDDAFFSSDVTVSGDLTVNGSLTYINTTNLNVTDKLITLNKGGAAASASNSGIEFEENDVITGHLTTNSTRNGFSFLSPAIASSAELLLSSLSSNRSFTLPDESGTLALGSGSAGRVSFWSSNHTLSSNANLFWDNTNSRLGIGTSSPSTDLHVQGSARITSLNSAQPVKSDVNGNLANGLISLTADVSGVLPIANGGTNSSTALNNNRIMVSSSGAIVEAAALSDGQLLIGSTGGAPVATNISGTSNQINITNGAGSITLSTPQDIHTGASPTFVNMTLTNKTAGSIIFAGTGGVLAQNNSNLFWDNTNLRLGIGTNVPARSFDLNGQSIFRDSMRLNMSSNSILDISQSHVSTTDATVTDIASIAIPTDSCVMVEARIVGRRTGGTAGSSNDGAVYVRTARFKNNGGVVTIHNLQSDYTSEDQNSWNGTIVASGTNAIIQVRGAANNNVNWSVTYIVKQI